MKINERWSYETDQHQVILQETYTTRGGKNPRTGEYHPPHEAVRETYHSNLRAAVLAAIDQEAKACESLEALYELTAKWEGVAREFQEAQP